ncbi:CAP domain-containing protein [Halorientalis sp. IM1011]|uniref:CAP domain-containing protein n=1 Tax=Halorientalis sp. IM1011 TaxID=1932360 RepID=UPI00155F7DFF|nr:CAP domain-containing protein [Halorientalis sp. IM1011]
MVVLGFAIVVVLIANAFGTGVAPLDAAAYNLVNDDTTTASQVHDDIGGITPQQESDDTTTGGSDDTEMQGGLDRANLEQRIHAEINSVRDDHGLPPISFDTDLRKIARYHSKDMADNEYFAHEAPNGETVEDRYAKFDYSCRGSGENILYTYYEERIDTKQGEVYHSSPDELAEGVVTQWMNSPGHRENILRSRWNREGVGVYVTETEEGTRVYVTQNFC